LTAQTSTKQEQGKFVKWAFVGVRAGLSWDRMNVKPDAVKLQSSFNPVVSAAFDVDYDGETIFRLEVSYKPLYFQTVGDNRNKRYEAQELKGFSILPEFQFCHKWRWPSNCHIYGGAGFGGRLSHVSRNDVGYVNKPPMGWKDKTLRLDENGVVLSCVAGLIYKSHYEMSLKFSNCQWGDNADNKISNSFLTLSVGYRL
jgi:hypothetical protein